MCWPASKAPAVNTITSWESHTTVACPISNTAYALYLSSTGSTGYPCTIWVTPQGPATTINYGFSNSLSACYHILPASTVVMDYLDPTLVIYFVCQGATGTVQVDSFYQKP